LRSKGLGLVPLGRDEKEEEEEMSEMGAVRKKEVVFRIGLKKRVCCFDTELNFKRGSLIM